MSKIVLEHIKKQDIPAKWIKLLESGSFSTYQVTIETEPASDATQNLENNKSWKDMPMFGMWEDRSDMNDPTKYVRRLRQARY